MDEISVQVVFALPQKQYVYGVNLPKNSTVETAIIASGILKIRPEIDLATTKVGIYSRIVKLTDTLKQGDRIEIYRPLTADPKELRRKRAERTAKQ
ncbi:RnfH family protein [Thorsellia anophelis]|uniref:UPF0125 protein SAMN02583745_02066 n=1 Tax=Thorsellia anophelis DSM 18579 TaxID=1123402 RepID=A0A1I0DPR7_9GAMM|nr:RnfH family protein [Thorsellia anophelis]SET34359.1 hypothetical protein SAMN02583745_02066 [Thorsellia anophelis DSM 18579]